MYPVHPEAGSVAGVRAYPSILEVPDAVDLAVVVVPAAEVLGVARQCAEKGVLGLIVISAGFAETGDDRQGGRAGARLAGAQQRHAHHRPQLPRRREHAPAVRMDATFAPAQPVAGNVAFLSQSGGLGIELMSRAGDLGIGISQFVSVGNKADVSGNDLLQFWADDSQTEVVLLYLESFGNPTKFVRLARNLARSKPIVAVKSGRTTAGSRAASSHTAALASSDVAVDALFRQAGVIRVDTLDELLSTAMVLAHQPLPSGRRVAIVSNAGGPGILAADACAGAGLEVAELAPATQDALRNILTPDATVRNPVDLVAGATAEQFEGALRIVLADVVDRRRARDLHAAARHARRRRRDRDRDRGRVGADRSRCSRASSVTSACPTSCAAPKAGGRSRRSRSRSRPRTRSVASPTSPTGGGGRRGRAARARRHRSRTRPFDRLRGDGARCRKVCGSTRCESTALLTCFGIPTVPFHEVADAATARRRRDAEIGFPVALKAVAAGLVHKSDVGGVHLDLPRRGRGRSGVRDRWRVGRRVDDGGGRAADGGRRASS